MGNPSSYNACQSFFLALLYILPNVPQNTLFLMFISPWTSFLASLHIFRSVLRQLDLNFLNNLPLKFNLFAISLTNNSLTSIFYSYSFHTTQFSRV